jgi:hypothetical protein
MSDQEWERWKTTFQQGGQPIPRVLKRARRDRRQAVVGLVLVYVILAVTMGSQVPALRHATPADVVAFVLALLGAAAMIVAVHVTMRGTFRATGAAPLDSLAQLERRHAGRLRLVRMIPWFAAFAVVGDVATEGFTMRALESLAWLVAGLAVYFMVFVRLWLRPRIDRDLREVAEARRLLGEVGDEPPEGKG